MLTLYKILDWPKFKALADDKINVTEKLKFVLGMVENILGKGENAGYQHFLLFPKCFQKLSFKAIQSSIISKLLAATGYWLLSHITNIDTKDSCERSMNPVAMTIINPRKEY